jgi:hypothetical protein
MAVTLNASTSSGLVQTADTSGTVEIQSNGTTRLTVASGGVTATNLTASGTFGGGVVTSGTAVTASSTSVDFTGIPSWVKQITVMFSGVSTSGASKPRIQLGDSGGVETTGYAGTNSAIASASASSANSTGGFDFNTQQTTNAILHGSAVLSLLNASTNTWVCNAALMDSAATYSSLTGGSKSLSATLDRVRITTVNGTDTFDAGSINILYEG